MFKAVMYHIIVPLAVTLVGIFIYHYAVTVPVMESLDRVQESALSLGDNTPIVVVSGDGDAVTAFPAEDGIEQAKKSYSVQEVLSPAVSFEIPHTVIADGTELFVPIIARIVYGARYVLSEAGVQGVEVSICGGAGECGLSAYAPLRLTQSLVALDIELVNKNRVGTIAIDPAKQMRFIYNGDFYLPYVMGGGNYFEVPELSTVRKTISAYLPRSAESVDLIYGADLERPSGLFRFDFRNGTVEALSG